MPARQPPAGALLYNPTTAERSTDFAISSASTCRLIFMEAVRGKSFSQTRYPPTRLKSGKRRLRNNRSSSNAAVEPLILFKTQDHDQRLHGLALFSARYSSRRKSQYSLTGQAIKIGFDVLGVNIFPALGDDHVFLAPEQLQMPVTLEPARDRP